MLDHLRHSGFRRWLALPLAVMAVSLGGCIIPIPDFPRVMPGYGHTYRIMDDGGQPIPAGVLLLQSEYERGLVRFGDRFSIYPVRDGRAVVPPATGLRVHPVSIPCWLPLIHLLHFQNPDHTRVWVVAPGYVMREAGSRIDGLAPPPPLIMRRADALEEAAYMADVDVVALWPVHGVVRDWEDRPDNALARRRVQAYFRERLEQLGLDEPLPATALAARRQIEERLGAGSAGSEAVADGRDGEWAPIRCLVQRCFAEPGCPPAR